MKKVSKIPFCLDRKKLSQLMKELVCSFESRSLVYSTNAPLEDGFPQIDDKLVFARFLFFAAMLTQNSKSKDGLRLANNLFKSKPKLFVGNAKKRTILQSLSLGGYVYPEQKAEYWKRVSVTIAKYFEGDPRNIFKEKNIGDVLKFKSSFGYGKDPLPGFGPKILSMLALWYEKLGLIENSPKDGFPVDLHVIRILIQHRVVTATTDSGRVVYQTLERNIRPAISEICEDLEISKANLNQAFYLLGSNLCSGCNTRKMVSISCPVYDKCMGYHQLDASQRSSVFYLSKLLPKGI